MHSTTAGSSCANACSSRWRRAGSRRSISAPTTRSVRIDYPDKAREIGEAINEGRAERGILICGSGVGVAVAASKIVGIRAASVSDYYSARQGVEHDDMNVLCLGAEVVGAELASELIRAFLTARFDGGERYVRRLKKVEAMEREMQHGEVTTA